MNGTRLSKFMESVDDVTGATGAAEPEERAERAGTAPVQGPPAPLRSSAPASAPKAAPAPPQGDDLAAVETAGPSSTAADPWAPLLDIGLRWLESLQAPTTPAGPRIHTNPATGQRSVTLPLPDPATLQRLASGLAGVLSRLGR